MKIDHVVQLVEDLGRAVIDWQGMGFTVSPGGVHADGHTHNALVIFRDGSYIELIAFRTSSTSEHRWARYRGFWGPIDFAVAVPNLADHAVQLKARNLPYSDAYEGGRKRPDGIQLRWRGSFPTDETLGLPFFIEDVTDRALRVPTQDENVLHSNGATGIARVQVLVLNMEVAADKFASVFGEGETLRDGVSFTLQGSTLSIAQPMTGSADAQFIAKRGAGPVVMTIAAPVPVVIKHD